MEQVYLFTFLVNGVCYASFPFSEKPETDIVVEAIFQNFNIDVASQIHEVMLHNNYSSCEDDFEACENNVHIFAGYCEVTKL